MLIRETMENRLVIGTETLEIQAVFGNEANTTIVPVTKSQKQIKK